MFYRSNEHFFRLIKSFGYRIDEVLNFIQVMVSFMNSFRRKCLYLFIAWCIYVINTQGQNYDESKVSPYILPNILISAAGKKIKNKSSWEKFRKSEIELLFKEYVYGISPDRFDKIEFKKSEDKAAMDGKALLRKVIVKVFKEDRFVTIHITLFLPYSRKKPMPVFLLINHRDSNTTDQSRKIRSAFWPAETLIDSGYAIAAFQVRDVSPDDKNKYQNGVLQMYPALLHADNGMKAIGSWAWGASRVLDYFITDKDIDAGKMIVIGHSRGGKAALWAGAQDQRFAIVISNCSGNSGAAIARRKFGETIAKINTGFPYWFSNNYKKFNEREDHLPVDQHMLIALMAPRPVYIGTAEKDLWADPYGSYLSLKYASPVYDLYKISTKAILTFPSQPLIHSHLGFHLREGGHDLLLSDWINYIRFANYHFKK